MYDLTLQTALLRGASLLLIASVFGAVATFVAARFGDKGPLYDGRGSLNPVAHLDWIGALAFVVFGLDWIKALALTPASAQPRWPARFAVVIAPALVVALMAVVASLLLPYAALYLSISGAPLADAAIRTFVPLALSFACLNLLPLPPFGGAPLLGEAAAAFEKQPWRAFIWKVVVVLVLASGLPGRGVAWVIAPLSATLLHTM